MERKILAVGSTVYVIASRPFPEKVSDSKFYFTYSEALEELNKMDEEIRESFKIYNAIFTIYSPATGDELREEYKRIL